VGVHTGLVVFSDLGRGCHMEHAAVRRRDNNRGGAPAAGGCAAAGTRQRDGFATQIWPRRGSLMVVAARLGTLADGASFGVRTAVLGAAVKGSIGAAPPRGSDDQSGQEPEYEPQDRLVGGGAGQVEHPLGLPCDAKPPAKSPCTTSVAHAASAPFSLSSSQPHFASSSVAFSRFSARRASVWSQFTGMLSQHCGAPWFGRSELMGRYHLPRCNQDAAFHVVLCREALDWLHLDSPFYPSRQETDTLKPVLDASADPTTGYYKDMFHDPSNPDAGRAGQSQRVVF
jgi:hypothetical protein